MSTTDVVLGWALGGATSLVATALASVGKRRKEQKDAIQDCLTASFDVTTLGSVEVGGARVGPISRERLALAFMPLNRAVARVLGAADSRTVARVALLHIYLQQTVLPALERGCDRSEWEAMSEQLAAYRISLLELVRPVGGRPSTDQPGAVPGP